MPIKYQYLAKTLHHWGAGKTGKAAVAVMTEEAGVEWAKKHGYELWQFSRESEIEVNPVDGSFQVERGVKVERVRNTTYKG